MSTLVLQICQTVRQFLLRQMKLKCVMIVVPRSFLWSPHTAVLGHNGPFTPGSPAEDVIDSENEFDVDDVFENIVDA